MPRKRLVIIYHHDANNEQIAQSDYDNFFEPIKKVIRPISELQIEPAFCPEVKVLIDKLQQLTSDKEDTEDLYLHFSGHGSTKGIPYGDWLLKNDDLTKFIDHDMVKSCFFSSCKSSELALLANKIKIPVVIGTLGKNDIENNFAIQFQSEFYFALLSRRTFGEAFELASAVLRNKAQRDFSTSLLTRGEGGLEEITNEQINALQLIFSGKSSESLRLLPTNFIREMSHLAEGKPCVISWSDDPVKAVNFEDAFRKKGYSDRLHFLNVPDEELELLNNRGENDPIALGEVKFLINISQDRKLPDEIRSHLREKKIFEMDNYHFYFMLKDGISIDNLIDDPGIRQRILDSNIFKFKNVAEALFKEDNFNRALESHEIPFQKRKKITLNFNSRPNKLEMVEVNDPNKFVRVFLAKNVNERLVNFLVNWIKSPSTEILNFQNMANPPIVVDNSINRNLNFMEQLKSNMRELYRKDQDLNFHLIEFLKEGGIIVFRNRYDTAEEWKQQIEAFLTTLSVLTPIFSVAPQTPSLLFFLHEEDVSLTFTQDKFHLKHFSDPDPIDDSFIDEWKSEHCNPLKSDPKVIQAVTEIAQRINQEEFEQLEMEFCQSSVIEHICDCLKIPRKQIVGI